MRASAGCFLEDDSGAAMVEFAIATSVFITLLLAILEFGFAAWARNSVAADAREGARYAIVHGGQSGRTADSATIANYVKSKTSLDNSIVVLTTWEDVNKTPGKRVTVKVKHAVPRRGPFLPAHTDSSSSTQIILF
jgi:Flp pilus assembly protein TadG